MGITEIILIVAGAVILFLGYALPARKKEIDDDIQLISEDEVRKLIDREIDGAKEHISDIVDETITYAIEKTERSMERLANEKIMAVNEYSDTVLEEINKNHKEVVFLYDMMNDRHETLKNTVLEAGNTVDEIKQTLKDAEVTAKEVAESITNTTDTAYDEGFVPFTPPKIEIVHDADGDYVAPDSAETDLNDSKPKAAKRTRKTSQTKAADKPAKKRTRAKKEPEPYEEEWKPFEAYDAAESEEYVQDAGPEYMTWEDESENSRNSNDRILELHKAGKSNMTIAKELGLGIGEVKLVIDLFEGL